MKNLFKFIILTIIASIALSSCQQWSVIKRKYTKGYYVSHSQKKANVKKQTSIVSVETEKPEYMKSVPITSLPQPEIKADAKEYAPIASNETSPKTASSHKTFERIKNFTGYDNAFKEITLRPNKLFHAEEKNIIGHDHASDALSLLWVIIIVILVLYLIGLLLGGFGLGFAIHILALVAVILLILWLLRIL